MFSGRVQIAGVIRMAVIRQQLAQLPVLFVLTANTAMLLLTARASLPSDRARQAIWRRRMFAVLFEVQPKPGQTDTYLTTPRCCGRRWRRSTASSTMCAIAVSRATAGCWRCPAGATRKLMVRWRAHARHHAVQGKGRTDVFNDYHLRIGEITADTRPPHGYTGRSSASMRHKWGDATTVTLIDASRSPEWVKATSATRSPPRSGSRATPRGSWPGTCSRRC